MNFTEDQIQQTLKALEHGMRSGSFVGLQWRTLGSAVWVDDSTADMNIEYRINPERISHPSLTSEQAAQHSLFDMTQKQYRLDLASRAPEEEIDAMIGERAPEAAGFIGVPVEDYKAKIHYPQCVVKARFMWADAMIKEANK